MKSDFEMFCLIVLNWAGKSVFSVHKHARNVALKWLKKMNNGLEKIIMQGMVAGKISRGKPRQRWEKDITDTFGMMAAASRVAEDRHQSQRHLGSDVLRRICFEKKKKIMSNVCQLA